MFCSVSAELSTVLCDNQKKAETLLQNREKGQTPVLKTIIIMDSFNSELVERGAKCGVNIASLEEMEVMHAEHKWWLQMSHCFCFLLAWELTFKICTKTARRHSALLKTCFVFILQALGKSNPQKPIVSF